MPFHEHMAMESRAEPCVTEQEEVSDSISEEMSSGLKDKAGHSSFVEGSLMCSYDVPLSLSN